MNTAQVSALSTLSLPYLSSGQLAGLTNANIPGLTTQQVSLMTTKQLAALSSVQLNSLSQSELNAITSDGMASLTTLQLAGMQSATLSAFSASQFGSLTSKQISSLKGPQIIALSTTEISGLTSTQIAFLSTNQLSQFTTSEIAALSTNAISGFSDVQLGKLSTDQLAAFTTTEAAYLKTLTPLVLDLSGIEALNTAAVAGLSSQAFNVLTSVGNDPGIQTQQIGKSGVSFDLGNTGQASNVGWITPGEGFLVHVPVGAKTITNGSELFGSATVMPNGQTAANGFAALAAFTTPGATEISASDPIFNELQVWVDTGTNDSKPTGTLFTLAELNITSLNLNASVANISNNGNTVGLISSYTTTDGKKHEMADVWLASTSGTLNSTAQLTAALSAYSPGLSNPLGNSSLNAGVNSQMTASQASTQSLTNSLAQSLTQSVSQYNSVQTGASLTPTQALASSVLNPGSMNTSLSTISTNQTINQTPKT